MEAKAHVLLSYRVQHLASGQCITSNDCDGTFLLRPCGISNHFQQFNILWDFNEERFLLFNVGARSYLNIATSPLYGEI
jgi:hypothetical protein